MTSGQRNIQFKQLYMEPELCGPGAIFSWFNSIHTLELSISNSSPPSFFILYCFFGGGICGWGIDRRHG